MLDIYFGSQIPISTRGFELQTSYEQEHLYKPVNCRIESAYGKIQTKKNKKSKF